LDTLWWKSLSDLEQCFGIDHFGYSASLRKPHKNERRIERDTREIADLFELRELTRWIDIEAFVFRFPERLQHRELDAFQQAPGRQRIRIAGCVKQPRVVRVLDPGKRLKPDLLGLGKFVAIAIPLSCSPASAAAKKTVWLTARRWSLIIAVVSMIIID
jgi:hypothetical protein